MQDHGYRLDEVAGDPPHTYLPLTVDPAEFYSAWQAMRILRLQQCRDLLWEVDSLLDTPPEEVPEGSRYLLELDFLTLYNATFERQSYWVLAMKAARWAGWWIAQTVKHQWGSKKCRTAAQRKPSRLKYYFTHDKRQMRHELGLDPAPRQQPHPDPVEIKNPSNKHLQKPNKHIAPVSILIRYVKVAYSTCFRYTTDGTTIRCPGRPCYTNW